MVLLVMADHRLARQMPQRYYNTFFYYCMAINYDLGVTDTLPSAVSVHHLLRQRYTAFALQM